MNLLQKYPFLAKLLSPFRRSQQKTATEIILALCASGAANSFRIAAEMSQAKRNLQLASAVNKFYRFLRNPRFDDWLLSEQLFAVFAERKRIILSLDWTSWHDRFSLLVASVAVDKRAVPSQSRQFTNISWRVRKTYGRKPFYDFAPTA